MRRIARLLVVLLSCPALAAAQGLGPDAARLAWVDRLAQGRQAQVSARWDEETGALARLRLEGGRPLDGSGEAAAQAARFVERELAPLLEDGLRAAAAGEPLAGETGLRCTGARELGQSRVRIDFAQLVDGAPVLAAGLTLELERTAGGLVPRLIFARYLPGIPAGTGLELDPQVEAGLAERFPGFESADLSAPSSWRLVIVRDPETGAARAAWAVEHPDAAGLGRTSYVDAIGGRVLGEESRACTATAEGQAYAKNPGQTPRASAPLTGLYVNQGANRVTTDAAGAHNLTGTVTLDQALSGPLVRVFVSGEDELAYSGPADIRLAPQEAAAAQDELAAFVHLTSFNAYLRATYPSFAQSPALTARFALLVRYKQNGQPVQNAFFTPGQAQAGGETFPFGYLAMGTFGGREAARSSSVVQHEYTHALLSRIVDLGGNNVQPTGINEGLADYFTSARDDDPRVGVWLANPFIRDLSRLLRWPDDNNGDPHRVGNIFAGALWDARTAAEQARPGDRLLVDQAVAAGIFRFPDRPSLLVAREAIVEADRAVNQGRFRRTLEDAFARHGIGPAAQNAAPTLTNPGDRTVQAGDTLTLTVRADDPDGDALTLAVSPLPNAVADGRTLRFSFSPDATQVGDHMVTLTVSDGAESASQTFRVTVDPGAAAPAAGGVGPVASSVAPGATAAPGGSSAARGGGGGGGGGCSLGAPGRAGWPALSLLVLGLLIGLEARRRAS